MASCPECKKDLPWGTAYQPGGGFGLPDKRKIDCPYCGTPLEPIRWTDYALLASVLIALMVGRRLLSRFVTDELLFVGVAAVIGYHLLTFWRGRTTGRH